MLRFFSLWLGLGWLMVAIQCYLSLTSNLPDINIKIEYLDKVGHFIAYFILMFWFTQLYNKPRVRLYYVIFFISMGVVLEILQGVGGVRHFEYYDMLANTFGVAVAWRITKGHLNSLFLPLEKMLVINFR